MSRSEYPLQSHHYLNRVFVRVLALMLVLCAVIWGAAQTSPKPPYGKDVLLLTLSRINVLPESEMPEAIGEMVNRVRSRGVSFKMTPAIESELRKAGATLNLIAAIREGYRPRATAPMSGGVLNVRAVSKPAPSYPRAARAARVHGVVVVEVVVDESGKVILAEAVSGHPLLRKAAVDAALQTVFSATKLGGRPVKVAGHITYNFVLPEAEEKD